MAPIQLIYFLLLLISNATNAQYTDNAYDNFIITGYSWENATGHTLFGYFLGRFMSFSKKNENQKFEIINYKLEKWDDSLIPQSDVNVDLLSWQKGRTVIWIPHEMSIAEYTLLNDIISMARNNVIDSGNELIIPISEFIRSAAKCTVYTTTTEISTTIYFCNGAKKKFNQLRPTYESGMLLIDDFQPEISVNSWMPMIFASAADHKHHRHHQHMFAKHPKKHVYGKKYELLKLRRKQEALKKKKKPKEASKILEIPMKLRKLICKYRKSCYDTGILPDTWNIKNILPSFLSYVIHDTSQKNAAEGHADDKDETKEEISKNELKLLCRYRKSCYEEVGAEIEKDLDSGRVPLLARRSAAVSPPKRRKTVEEMASIALAKVKEREKLAALRPKSRKVIIDKKLSEIEEQMKKRLTCKYRKSCYESGVLPMIISPISNPFSRIYSFIRQQIHGSSMQEIVHKKFSDLEENEKKIYCKYRKSCYSTGEKPIIQHGQLFKYEHVVKKHEELIPLEIRCKYRKSCYETGVLPDLRKENDERDEKENILEPVKKIIKSLQELRSVCKYRLSCYRQKANESQDSSVELFERIVKRDTTEVQPEDNKEKQKEKLQSHLPIKDKSKKIKEITDNEETDKKKTKLFRMNSKKGAKTEKQEARDQFQLFPKVTSEMDKEEKAPKRRKILELKKKSDYTKTRNDKDGKSAQKLKRKKMKESSGDHEGQLAGEQKVPQNTIVKIRTKEEMPEFVKTEAKPKKVQKVMKEAKYIKTRKEELEKEKELSLENEEGGEMEEAKEKPFTESPPTKKKTEPIEDLERALSHSRNISEVLPRKINIHDENLSALEIKLLCKYRKSCYENGELPPIFTAKTIKHLKEKDEQHKPLEIRCKYRKSCYETGKLPENLHGNFKAVHMTEKKDQLLPLGLRCKYRKSCYETGKLPPIESKIFLFPTLQNFLKNYEEYTEKELTENEKKLRCKYRKSCYKSGQLPTRLNQTVQIIASSIKEQYMSPQLRCKYRKSCYESMKLEIQLDKIREKEKQKKPQEGILKTQYSKKSSAQHREKEHKQKVSDEEIKDEESGDKRKRMKSEADEQEYMQIALLDTQLRPKQTKTRSLSSAQKLKCKYRLKCYDGVPLKQLVEEKRAEKEKQVNIKDFRRANGAICNIYYISCRKQAGLPIRERAPIGPNGRRLCRKKKNKENIY